MAGPTSQDQSQHAKISYQAESAIPPEMERPSNHRSKYPGKHSRRINFLRNTRGETLAAPSADAPATAMRASPTSHMSRAPSKLSQQSKPFYKESALPVEERDPIRMLVDKLKIYNRNTFKPMMIIYAPSHEQDAIPKWQNPTHVDDPSITLTSWGRVHPKIRKIIIVKANFDNQYLALPLYSHEGKGVANKNKEEYMAVVDHRSKKTECANAGPPLLTNWMVEDVEDLLPTTVCHISSPFPRKFSVPCFVEGELARDATEKLVKAFKAFMARD